MARVDEIIVEVQEANRKRKQIEAEQNEQAKAKLKWLFDQLNLAGARLAYDASARQGCNGIDVEVWRFGFHLCSLTKHAGAVRLCCPEDGSELDFASEDDALRRVIEILHADSCKRPSDTPAPTYWCVPEPYSILSDYHRELEEASNSSIREHFQQSQAAHRGKMLDRMKGKRPPKQEGQEGPRS